MLYSQKIIRNIKYISILGDVFGANFLKDDFRMTWLTWSVFVLIHVAIAFTFYTIYTILVIEKSVAVILKCMCMFGTGIQGYVKLVNVINNEKLYRIFRDEIIQAYKENENKHNGSREYLMEALLLQNKLFIMLCAMYTSTMFGVIFVPVYYLIYRNERLFLMPFYIPMLDPTTDIGYFTTFGLHILCILAGGYGNLFCDTWSFLIVSHIALHKNILKSKFYDLDESLVNHSEDLKKTKIMLRDIFEWHQKYINFTNSVKSAFFWIIFCQIFTAFTGIVCTIVCLFLKVWPAASVYLIYSFVNMYLFCGIGNIVENANDDVTVMIYDCCWYLLSVSEQKMILIMLRKSQTAEGMTIGDISPLSMSTALQLTKTIYSVAMMFNQFLN